jgi:hypothetical protein
VVGAPAIGAAMLWRLVRAPVALSILGGPAFLVAVNLLDSRRPPAAYAAGFVAWPLVVTFWTYRRSRSSWIAASVGVLCGVLAIAAAFVFALWSLWYFCGRKNCLD